MKSVEEYAVWLVAVGAEARAANDRNEDGDISEAAHPDACSLAADMAAAISNNPRSFAEWCEGMGVRWNRHNEEG